MKIWFFVLLMVGLTACNGDANAPDDALSGAPTTMATLLGAEASAA